jgi:hypothetical protein
LVKKSLFSNGSGTHIEDMLGSGKAVATEEMVRRSVRNTSKQDGFKLDISSCKTTPRKKAQSAKPFDDQNNDKVTPFIPIHVLQQVGAELQIDEEDLAAEKLMAAPEEDKPKTVPNEE